MPGIKLISVTSPFCFSLTHLLPPLISYFLTFHHYCIAISLSFVSRCASANTTATTTGTKLSRLFLFYLSHFLSHHGLFGVHLLGGR